MNNEAGMETVLSAAYSLKLQTDMKKTSSTLQEAQDKAKEMKMTPEKAAKCIRATPNGRFAIMMRQQANLLDQMTGVHLTFDH